MPHKLWISAVALMGLLFAANAYGQAGAAAAGAAARNSGGPEAASSFGKDANYATLAEHQHGSMHFTGNVKVEDAAFPWDPIPVIVTCNGVVRYRTQADAKGGFVIQSSRAVSEVVPTKTNPHQASASQLIGCDAEASVPGFTSSKLHIANLNIMDNPDIGTIVLRPDSAASGTSTSATTAAAPKDAMKKFDQARSDWISGNAKGAQRNLEKAVKDDPQFAEAWYQLGKLQRDKNPAQALGSFKKAIAADPKFVSPYVYIAEQNAIQKKWQDVSDATSQALKLSPAGTPQLWYYDALARFNLGKTDEAEASAREAIEIDP